MNVFLAHIDWGPVLYGVIMFIGLLIMWVKLLKRKWLSLIIDISVFTLVFKLHGGTMAGGFSAMICAMFAGMVFPTLIRRKRN